MATKTRTAIAATNIKVALTFYAVNLFLQFISRKVFIEYLGTEVLGLNTTATNLMGFLNLAELGISGAVAVNLYKPLFSDDRIAVQEIVSIQGWLYRKIAWFVIAGSAIMMCFFPQIFNKAELPLWYAYGSFCVLLLSSLLGYFVNYRQIVLTADQKEYKTTIATQSARILKVILQILTIRYLSHGYIWWMTLEMVFAFISAYALDKTIHNEYPWLKTNIHKGPELRFKYPDVITKTKLSFFHRITTYVFSQTTPLILYGFTTLSYVAIYGNYIVIITGLKYIANAIFNGIMASVGNLVAEGDKTKIKRIFWEYSASRMWLAAILSSCFYQLADSFISVWIGPEYILPKSAIIVLSISLFFDLSRITDPFINAYGLFQDVWATITECILNLSMSIILGHYYGLTGILCGVLISQLLIIQLWKPIFLYRKGFKEKMTEYPKRFLKLILLLITSTVACKYLMDKVLVLHCSSILLWALKAAFFLFLYAGVSATLLLLFDNSFRCICKRLFNYIAVR